MKYKQTRDYNTIIVDKETYKKLTRVATVSERSVAYVVRKMVEKEYDKDQFE